MVLKKLGKNKKEKKKSFFESSLFVKNKKGFLLAEETLKILVAVIALSFLVYFLVSLYFAKVKGDKFEQAESLLISSQESFEVIIKNIEEGEVRQRDVIEPKGWAIFGFVGPDLKPNACGNQNCLCVCDEVVWEGFNSDRQQKECSEGGICLPEESLGDFRDIKIEGSDNLKVLDVVKNDGRIYIRE